MRLAFTATRKLRTHGQRMICRARLVELANTYEVTEVTTGGAPGGDTFIAGVMRELCPDAFHRLVLPREPGNEALVRAFERGLAERRFRGEIVWTGLGPLDRNHVILDHGDRLDAFPAQADEQWRGSGTWATWRYAGKRAMPRTMTVIAEETDG